jgi:uncharacterized membrane protein (Fun14 family)
MTLSQTAGVRAGLAYLALGFVLIGIWAQLFPQSFYDDFPGLDRAWVRIDGPFNEHLIRDVGGLNLGLGLAAIFAMRFLQTRVIQVVCLVIFVYSLPHYLYHLAHLSVLPSTLDQVANIVLLGLNVFIPLALMIVASRVKTT